MVLPHHDLTWGEESRATARGPSETDILNIRSPTYLTYQSEDEMRDTRQIKAETTKHKPKTLRHT